MIQLDPFQQEAIVHKGNLLLCTGRRVGKTYIMALKAIKRMLEKKTSVVVVSLTEEQAMMIIAMAKNILLENSKSLMMSRKEQTNKKTITLRNGSTMKSRAVGNDGDSIRGFEADIILIDEASRMGKLFWIAITPLILTTRGEMWLCSTPHGKQGYFWDRFNEVVNLKIDNGFKVIYVTTEQIMRDRPIGSTWTQEQRDSALKQLEQEKRVMSALEYGQEYLGLFLDELRQYFADETIEKACIYKRRKPIGSVFMGCDIARMGGDKTTYEFIDKVTDDKMYHIESIVKGKQDTVKTEEEIIYYSQAFNVQKVGIDAGSGSLGIGIYDRLFNNEITRDKVVAMTNQKVSLNRDKTEKQRIFKEDMYENLNYLMETGKIKLLDDPDLKNQLRSIQIELIEGKVRIFANPSADIVEGLVRAAYLAEKQKINKLFVSYF
jgi:hypothetical protein